MKRNKQVQLLTLNALLIGLGIFIPTLPFKIQFPPFFSFTLASHVPVFIAMFINPQSAILVALGTALGFVFSTGNMMIVARAVSHIVFAIVGSLILKRNPDFIDSTIKRFQFNLMLGVIHAICEFVVVIPFVTTLLNPDFLWTMFLFLGLGTLVHSMIDFMIAYRVVKVTLRKS